MLGGEIDHRSESMWEWTLLQFENSFETVWGGECIFCNGTASARKHGWSLSVRK